MKKKYRVIANGYQGCFVQVKHPFWPFWIRYSNNFIYLSEALSFMDMKKG
jgi:hypothetical protein